MRTFVKRVRSLELALTILAHSLNVGPRVLAISNSEDARYWLMEIEDGGMPLGLLKQEEKKDIKEQLLYKLSRLHSAGILHSDMSEENVVVNDGVVSIIDFGLSRLCSDLNVHQTAVDFFDSEAALYVQDLLDLEKKETELLIS
jgi:tRNA A-37 threonylcarbamoyl transferase component Bud32